MDEQRGTSELGIHLALEFGSIEYVEVDVALPLKVLEKIVQLVAGMDGDYFTTLLTLGVK